MNIFTPEELKTHLLTTYDEKIKDKKLKNSITKRWRMLGLLEGIQQNSKTEKLIIEMYERMATYLITENKTNDWFNAIIFPLIRLLYTGEKSTGKKINFIVMPEVLYETLSNLTLEATKPIFENNVPKSVYNRKSPLFNLIEYKRINKKSIIDITESDFILTTEETCLLTSLFPSKNKTQFDFEAEVFALVNSCVVFLLKNVQKNKEE